jgi:D-threo-aldose 1-dehydrogenase
VDSQSKQSSSAIGFGTGGLLRIAGARRRQDVLAAAFAHGITHFDTAPLYGFGESERALGRFIRDQRDKVTITTKFGLRPTALATRLAVFQQLARQAIGRFPALRRAAVRSTGVLNAPPCFALSEVRMSLERSLTALRTDHIDFYLAHQASPQTLPSEELTGFLAQMRDAGKIRAFGVATEYEWLLPVLQQRPQLSQVLQFDSDLGGRRIAALPHGPDRLVIIYTLLGRTVARARQVLSGDATADEPERRTQLAALDDQALGGLLLRAAVLANPGGIVLMQSRSAARIAGNVRAVTTDRDDHLVTGLAALLDRPSLPVGLTT